MSGFVDKKSYDQLMDDRNQRIDENTQLKARISELEEESKQWEKESLVKIINERGRLKAENEGLTKKVKNLTAWYDKMFGAPCEEIRHQQQVEALETERDQLKAEVNQLKAELAQVSIERDEVRKLYDAGKAAWDPVYQIVLTERDHLKAELAEARYLRENAESALNTHMEIHARVVNELRQLKEGA